MNQANRPKDKRNALGFLGGPPITDGNALKQRAGIIIALSIVINLLALVQPVFMLHVYDFVLPSQSLPTLFYLTLIAVFLIFVTAVLDFFRARTFADAAWDLDEKLRPMCFKASYEIGKKSGRSGRSVFASDLESIKQFLSSPTPSSLLDLPWTIFFLIALFFLAPTLGFLALGFVVIAVIVAVMNDVSLRTFIKEGTVRGHNAQRLSEDVFQALDAVEGMKFSEFAVSRWSDEAKAQAAYARAASARNGAWTSVARNLRLSLQVLMLAASALLVLEGKLSSGAMIAASIIGARALAPIDSAVAGWRSTGAAFNAWQRLGQLTQSGFAQAHDMTALPSVDGKLSAEGLSVVTDTGVPILMGINFAIPKGTFLGLVGASGSGKTTLARAMVGAINADAGKVRIDDIDIKNWPLDRLRAGIGYMPQNVQLLSGTIAENIRRLGPKDDEGVIEAAKLSGAHAMIVNLPKGYDSQIGEGGMQLSGGQRALIGLARAFYGNPSIVVLDEPAANLDATSRLSFSKALRTLRRDGKTLVLVSHDVASLRSFDYVVTMNAGRVEKITKAEETNPAAAEPKLQGAMS
jgi:PrtD family type I secretion system ABC transporter